MLQRLPADATPAVGRVVEPDATASVLAHDGVALATDVYVPSSPRKRSRCTTILLRTPYGKRGTIDRVAELAPFFAAAGVAVVAQDVRGKHASDGSIAPFLHEVADGYATVQWISEQSWSNGCVVPFGDSYAGFTSWAAAASGHPAIRAAVVRVTTCHLPDEWMYRQGVFRLQQNGPWAIFAWGGRELFDVEPDWHTRPLGALNLLGADTSQLIAWLRTSPNSQRWGAEILGQNPPLSRRVDIPVLHWGGWWDLMARGQVREWQDRARADAAPQLLLMGATDHSFNHFSCTYGAPPTASFNGQYEVVAEFVSNVERARVGDRSHVRWELTHDSWYDDPEWPPRDSRPQRLYLADGASATFGPEGGALSSRPDTVATTIRWLHDPSDLVPSLETWVWGTLASDYPDERDVHVRPDVVTFSGAPAGELLDLVGPVTLRLAPKATIPTAHITATLSDVHPDGRALRIAEGACEFVTAEAERGVELDLGPLAYRLREGHRLRLALACSAFPRYLWYAADRVRAWSADGGTPYELALRLGRESYLEARVNHDLGRRS